MSIQHEGRPVRGVIFDMDGVLVDTRQAHIDAWLEWSTSVGQPIDPNEFMRRTFGRGNMQILPDFYPDRRDDLEFLKAKSEEKESLFVRRLRAGEVELVPGVREFIELLKREGTRMCVGSSAPRMNIVATLDVFGLTSTFPITVSMEDVKHAKPDPEIFLIACERMGLQPADCVVIEDSIHGLDAARAAGARAVGVLTMHTQEELRPHAPLLVRDFHELMSSWGVSANAPRG